jgi:nucleoid-associated protein YgaU
MLTKQGRQSPDVSHMVEVMEGDTLPSLCKKIYDNPNYYVEIAKINQLKSVRNLKVGQKLYFPPLK